MNIDTSAALKFQNACDPMPNRYKPRLFRVTTHWTKQTSIPLLFSMKSFRTKDLSLEYRIILGHSNSASENWTMIYSRRCVVLHVDEFLKDGTFPHKTSCIFAAQVCYCVYSGRIQVREQAVAGKQVAQDIADCKEAIRVRTCFTVHIDICVCGRRP